LLISRVTEFTGNYGRELANANHAHEEKILLIVGTLEIPRVSAQGAKLRAQQQVRKSVQRFLAPERIKDEEMGRTQLK